jgi:hypothetical protein
MPMNTDGYSKDRRNAGGSISSSNLKITRDDARCRPLVGWIGGISFGARRSLIAFRS